MTNHSKDQDTWMRFSYLTSDWLFSCNTILLVKSKSHNRTLSYYGSCEKLFLKPHLHALKNRHGTPNFWHRADDFKARHSQFSTCKRIGPKCNMAPVLKSLGVARLPPGGSLGTGKRGTVQKIWRAVPIFLVRVILWGFKVRYWTVKGWAGKVFQIHGSLQWNVIIKSCNKANMVRISKRNISKVILNNKLSLFRRG